MKKGILGFTVAIMVFGLSTISSLAATTAESGHLLIVLSLLTCFRMV